MTLQLITSAQLDNLPSDMPRISPLRGSFLIAVLTCLAYWPSIHGRFILDDDIYLTDCRYIAATDGLYWFWFTNAPLDFYPVSNTTLWFEWRLWGLQPTGYHVTNLLLHIASALLVWAILRKLSVPGAFLAALLFAVHPVNVEAVAWIAQRKDLLATLFFLLAILWYLKAESVYHPENSGPNEQRASVPTPAFDKWYRLSLLAFVLAMLSKGSPAILPIVLLELAWWQRRRITRLDLRRTVPFFLVAVALALINVWTQHRVLDEPLRSGCAERFAGAGAVVWFYLSKALLPIHLAFVYPLWHIQVNDVLWWLPLIAALTATAFLIARQTHWSRPLLFAWVFFGVAFLPVMGFADVGFMRHSLVADHYQHIAIIGVIALLAAAWTVWHDRARRAVRSLAIGGAIAVIVVLTFLTWQQNRLYADPITLYHATLEKNPDSWLIRNNLGNELIEVGQPLEAIEQCQRALLLKPDSAQIVYNIATAQKLLGRFDAAIESYRQAVLLQPNFPDALKDFGVLLGRLGRIPEAIAQFQNALDVNPNDPDAHSDLGLALFKADRFQEAIEQFEAALRLQPNHAGAHVGLAAVFARDGRLQQAVEHYQQALMLRPQFTEGYVHLAEVYAQMQQPTEAIDAAHKALGLARAQGQTALENQIQTWLDEYLAQQSKAPAARPDVQAAP